MLARITLAAALTVALYKPALAEDVQPHLFDDLNANQISDIDEARGTASSDAAQPAPEEVQEISYPDTPPETTF